MYIPSWPGAPVTAIQVQDRSADEVANTIHRVHNVTSEYFTVHGIPVVAGRDFTVSDAAGAQRVGIIGRKLAERFWPGMSPLGRQLHLGGAGDDWITIVGVVPSYRSSPFARDTALLLYLPLAQHATAQPSQQQLSLHLRAGAGATELPARVRAAAAAVDPDLVVENVRSARDSHAQWTAPVRITALVVAALGGFALLLACMGIYGLIAFTVSQRTPEIGVRIALGATRGRIVRLVLRQALILSAIGLVFGLLGAVGLGGVLRNRMNAANPLSIVLFVPLVIGFPAIAALASWLPARRAARIDPMAALRAD
jgi:hypothetical protein